MVFCAHKINIFISHYKLFLIPSQKGDQKPNKDFKKTRTKEDVHEVFTEFIGDDEQLRVSIIYCYTLEVFEFSFSSQFLMILGCTVKCV